jgi:malate dehydrogenase
MVPLLSSSSIGGILMKYYDEYDTFDLERITEKVKSAGTYVIGKKGATEYGPAFAISNIIKTILRDEKKIPTLTTYLDGEIEGVKDVCLGVPVKLGRNGVEQIISLKMNNVETRGFLDAAKIIKKATDEVMVYFKDFE